MGIGSSIKKAFKYPLLPGAGLLTGESQTQEQVPLETSEQKAARQKLMEFANTGTYGGFTAGAEVPLGYGDFSTTDLENQGLSSVQSLLNSGLPDQYRLGDEALQDLLSNDPAKIAAQFDPFKAQTERQIKESNTALKRGAGFAGNLYSTSTIRGLGDIQARGNETLTSQLANLTNEALNRKERAIPLAYQSGQQQENIKQQRIAAAMEYGDLTRQLNDASIKARDAEILRRRTELQLPLGALQSVAGQNANFGIPSITTTKDSELMPLLNIAAQVGGRVAGASAGGK